MFLLYSLSFPLFFIISCLQGILFTISCLTMASAFLGSFFTISLSCISLHVIFPLLEGDYILWLLSCLGISACCLYQICRTSWLGIISMVHIFFLSELCKHCCIFLLILNVAMGKMRAAWIFCHLKEVLVCLIIL